MSNLVLFTVRSGSTLLSDILAYADGSINLGEGAHSIARSYNYNRPENKESQLFQIVSSQNLTSTHHNVHTRGSDHIGFYKSKNERLDLIKQSSMQWTMKENTEKLTIDFNFIEYCCRNNINVYMTHRENIVDQFISKINARYRSEIAKTNSDFIFTNNDSLKQYDSMNIKFTWLHMYTNVFIEQLMMWRILYDRFKPYVKIVSYENEIKPMNFSKIGIKDSVVANYKQETQHLVPTPHNTKKVIVMDDHPKPIAGAWEQSLHYIERFKYLVEI